MARRGRTNCDQPTDYATRSRSDQALCVVAKIRNLRKPIVTTINGQACTLLTVGYVTRALGRSNWTIKHWTRLGLLPPAPFVLRPNIANTRRPLYPAQYVQRLKEIAAHGYLGTRLDYQDWPLFHAEVTTAYEETVTPLFSGGVTQAPPLMVCVPEGGQGK